MNGVREEEKAQTIRPVKKVRVKPAGEEAGMK